MAKIHTRPSPFTVHSRSNLIPFASLFVLFCEIKIAIPIMSEKNQYALESDSRIEYPLPINQLKQ